MLKIFLIMIPLALVAGSVKYIDELVSPLLEATPGSVAGESSSSRINNSADKLCSFINTRNTLWDLHRGLEEAVLASGAETNFPSARSATQTLKPEGIAGVRLVRTSSEKQVEKKYISIIATIDSAYHHLLVGETHKATVILTNAAQKIHELRQNGVQIKQLRESIPHQTLQKLQEKLAISSAKWQTELDLDPSNLIRKLGELREEREKMEDHWEQGNYSDETYFKNPKWWEIVGKIRSSRAAIEKAAIDAVQSELIAARSFPKDPVDVLVNINEAKKFRIEAYRQRDSFSDIGWKFDLLKNQKYAKFLANLKKIYEDFQISSTSKN